MSTSLVQSLQEHDRYFSRVIDTIPADLYKHTLSEDVDGAQEGKYSKNRKMPLTSEERKTISKAKKTEKYAAVAVPAAAISPAVTPVESVTEHVVEKSNEMNGSTGSNNLEDLRQRLQARIQGMKNQRTSNKSAGKAALSAAPKSDNIAATASTTTASAATTSSAEGASNGKTLSSSEKKNKHKLAAQEREQAKRVRRVGTAINDASDVSIISLGSTDSAPVQQAELGDDISVNNSSITSFGSSSRVGGLDADLQFSLIAQSTVLGAAAGEGELAAKASKPKGNKLQRLQRLLAEAEKKRARVKQLTAHGGEEGLSRLQGEKWNDALKSAKGERTLIVGSSSIEGSEGKLKSALKKIEKRKARSADKWADRLAAVEDTERLKIQKREGNINQRRMKMKGIDIPADTAVTAAPGAAGKDPSGPGSGRKRLYHVLKYGNSDQQEGGGGEGKGAGGGDKKATGGGTGANRAGFEGKKKGYLNK